MIEHVRSYRFTIKQIFKEHWENYLSSHKDSLRQDVIWTIEKMLSWSKERHFLPAMVSSYHTSGRNLRFHPHIHMLMSSGGIDLKSKRLWPLEIIFFHSL